MNGHILTGGYDQDGFCWFPYGHILGDLISYLLRSDFMCSSRGDLSFITVWYMGVLGKAFILKNCFSIVSSLENSRGASPASVHRLTAGEDLKAPVQALRQVFCMGSSRFSTPVVEVP